MMRKAAAWFFLLCVVVFATLHSIWDPHHTVDIMQETRRSRRGGVEAWVRRERRVVRQGRLRMPWVEMEPPLQRGGSARERTTVVATMVTRAEGRDEAAYIRMTTNWVRQLEYHGIPRESLLILVTSDVATKNLEAINALKTVVKVMPPLRVEPSVFDASYHNQPSKLWLWNMTEYETILYYDSDFIFTSNPMKCAARCPPQAAICAVRDTAWMQSHKHFPYFNAGFLILTPNSKTAAFLIANIDHAAARKEFVEQDMLNQYYKGQWYELEQQCNHILPGQHDFASKEGVAFHAKIAEVEPGWVLDTALRRLLVWSQAELNGFKRRKEERRRTDGNRDEGTRLIEQQQRSQFQDAVAGVGGMFGAVPSTAEAALPDCWNGLKLDRGIGCHRSGLCEQCPLPGGRCCRKGWIFLLQTTTVVVDPSNGEGCAVDEGCDGKHCCIGATNTAGVEGTGSDGGGGGGGGVDGDGAGRDGHQQHREVNKASSSRQKESDG